MAPTTRRIVIIQGHPDPEGTHFCHAVADAYARGALQGGQVVSRVTLAAMGLPLLRSRADQQAPPPAPIRQAQAEISAADHLVLIYPIWNGSSPALVRGFLEQVFRPAFTLPDAMPGQHLGFTSAFTLRKALVGKSARIISTMQMPAWLYRAMFHPHLERNTLRVSGFAPVRETLIGLVESADPGPRARALLRVEALGRQGR